MKTGLQEHKSVHMLTYFTPVICLFFSGCLRVWPDLAHWKPRPQWGKLKVQRSTRSSTASPCSPHHLPSDLTWPDLMFALPRSFSSVLHHHSACWGIRVWWILQTMAKNLTETEVTPMCTCSEEWGFFFFFLTKLKMCNTVFVHPSKILIPRWLGVQESDFFFFFFKWYCVQKCHASMWWYSAEHWDKLTDLWKCTAC